jgi:hypothetical protein
MNTFFTAAGLVLALAAAMTATGWAVANVAGVRRLRNLRFEAVLANSLTGTAVWILVFGWCSYLGYSVQEVRWPLAGTWLTLLALAFRSGAGGNGTDGTHETDGATLQLPGASSARRHGPVLLFAGAAGLASAFILWPLFDCAAAWPFSDALTYCAISSWLQEHGMRLGVIAVDADRPMQWFVAEYQQGCWRMGSTFFLAIVQGYTGLDALLAFPIVMAWGMLLNLAGIFLMARWTFRLNRWLAAGTCFAAAAALNPLHTSIQQGFQPQTFGTAYFSASLAFLARAARPTFWDRANALPLALVVTACVSVYSEMAPILALVGAAHVAHTLVLAWRSSRASGRSFARFCGWTLLGLLALGNVEWLRAIRAIQNAIGAHVGFPVPWQDSEYWGFALGQLHFNHRPGFEFKRTVLMVLASSFLLLGLRRVFRDRRAMVAGFALLVFAAMAAYFRFAARDPNTGEIGHHWSLYKLSKWAFPLLLAVQFAGLGILLRRFRWRPWLCIVPGIAVFAMSFGHHRQVVMWAGTTMRAVTGSAHPVEEWGRLNAELDRLGVDKVYLLRRDGDRVPDVLIPYAMCSRRFTNGWAGCDLELVRNADPTVPDPEAAVLMIGPPPLGPDGTRLPGNLTLLDRSRPHLFHVHGALPQKDAIAVAERPVTCSIWSSRAGLLRITADTLSERVRSLVVEGPDGEAATVFSMDERGYVAEASGVARIVFVFSVPAGRCRFQLKCADGHEVGLARLDLEIVEDSGR